MIFTLLQLLCAQQELKAENEDRPDSNLEAIWEVLSPLFLIVKEIVFFCDLFHNSLFSSAL